MFAVAGFNFCLQVASEGEHPTTERHRRYIHLKATFAWLITLGLAYWGHIEIRDAERRRIAGQIETEVNMLRLLPGEQISVEITSDSVLVRRS